MGKDKKRGGGEGMGLCQSGNPLCYNYLRMDEWEPYAYQKIKQDFTTELSVLDKGIDIIEQCIKSLIKDTPLLHKPDLNTNLTQAKPAIKRSVSNILLIQHATTSLRAARLLLLNAYLSSSLACLRVTVEAILNAHVCKQSSQQAMNWVNCEKIERRKFRYPREMPKTTTNTILNVLHEHGAHPNYLAFHTQGYTPGIVFSKENQPEYEFFTLRNIHIALLLSSVLLKYVLNKNPELRNKFPDAVAINNEIVVKTRDIAKRLQPKLRIHTRGE